MPKTARIESAEITAAIDKMAEQIAAAHPTTENLVLAGIANGGIEVAKLLGAAVAKRLGRAIPTAVIDVSFHRDDIGQNPLSKEVEATELAHNPEDAVIILVDDVLFSGRTVRAAIEEVLTLGRPNKIELATLVDRGNHRLPIAADYTGISLSTTPNQSVKAIIDLAAPEKSRIDIVTP